ncbi:hypothetical protein COU53_02880 [Candidatus Pacearchaeota archaeon CG10_big_fil_rev_8_21_14_0_10_30_48]|nr:MAG: hypothetical protein COU53_02880 [Candidatus Pacearchaeota archaeon CG10_big_fil_rev_8_21_14_0_10_30_48]
MVKDTPISEIILRKYERPYGIEKRDLIKKICLSLGLLQPGDSRDVIVDILQVLTESQKEKKKLDSIEIGKRVEELRKKENLEIKGVAESNIRRQLKRLRDLMIIEKNNNLYCLSEFESLNKIFEDKIEKFIVQPSIERIKEYLKELDN